jgi:hypothetical protein
LLSLGDPALHRKPAELVVASAWSLEQRWQRRSVDVVQVFTLGADEGRQEVSVPVSSAWYDLLCEPVSVGSSK